jgi:Flp pilus assembly protein CpaB
MKRKSLLVIISSFTGLIIALLYAERIQHIRDEIHSHSLRVSVLTVNRNINIGETLLTEDLVISPFLKENLSTRAVRPEDLSLIVGRRVIHPVPANDPILWTDFPGGPRIRRPTEKVPSGYRMIALPADEIHTLTHFVTPGDRVDIISSNFDSSNNRVVSTVLAEDIMILGIGHQMDGEISITETDEPPLSVSILVNPQTALEILRASQMGEIHFLARGSDPFTSIHDHKYQARELPGDTL